MTGIDTNVLLRYLVGDHAAQSALSKRFLEQELSQKNPGYISTVVLAETIWVLRTSYDVSRERIVEIVEGFLGDKTFILEHEYEVFQALVQYRTGSLDFSDALLGAIASAAGCDTTVTFDRRAARHGGFTLL